MRRANEVDRDRYNLTRAVRSVRTDGELRTTIRRGVWPAGADGCPPIAYVATDGEGARQGFPVGSAW